MNFKEFYYKEDNGLMGFGVPALGRKPSNGQPFRNLTSIGKSSPAAAAQPNSMGEPAMMMMRKMMKKKMKKY